MKKRFLAQVYFLFSLVLLTSVLTKPVNAQNPGKYASGGILEFGGNVSYQYLSVITSGKEEYSYNIFSFYPYIGYFVCDNFEIGINPLGIQTSWNARERSTLLSIFVCPAYVFDLGEKIYPFVEAQAGYTSESIVYEISQLNMDGKGFSWGGRAGIKYLLSKSCLINIGVQYRQITVTPIGESLRSGSNSLMLSAGFTFCTE